MYRIVFLINFVLLFLGIANFSWADVKVLLKVNSNPITNVDVNGRVNLLRVGERGKAYSVENLKKEAIRQLVVESLQIDYAKKHEIVASQEELNLFIKNVASSWKEKDIFGYLKSHKISLLVFKQYVLAQVLWRKILDGLVARSDKLLPSHLNSKVDEFMKNYKELEVRDIVIPFDGEDSKLAKEALSKANKIYEDINNKKLSFAEAANKFSKSYTSNDGGLVGWFSINNLPASYKEYILNLKVGEITKPIVINNQVIILNLNRDRVIGIKKDIVNFSRLILTLGTAFAAGTTMNELVYSTTNKILTCSGLEAEHNRLAGTEYDNSGDISIGNLNDAYSRIISKMKIGQIAPVEIQDGDILLLMLCKRETKEHKVSKDEALKRIYDEAYRAEMIQKSLSLMAQLYQSATILYFDK